MKKFYLIRNLFSLSFTFKISPPNLYKSYHCFSSLLPKNSKSVPISDYLIHRHGFSPEAAIKASSVITSIRNPEKSDSVLAFLRESGFSNPHVEKLIEVFPMILASNVEKTIKPKFKIFLNLGFSPDEVADIFVACPWMLRRSDKRLSPSIILLKQIVGTNSGISKVLKGSAWFLHHDLEKTMVPNIEYMKSCGIDGTQITKFLFTFPRFFIRKPEAIKDLVKRVDELGFDRKSRMYLHAIRAMGSMTSESWEVKLQLFRSLGWSEDDLVFTFRRTPSVFTVSNRKIRDGAEFLLGTGKYSSSFLVLHPELLVYSLESRIKPRLQVFEILKSKNLISKVPSLTTICKMVDIQFIKKYVLPYVAEVGNFTHIQHRKRVKFNEAVGDFPTLMPS